MRYESSAPKRKVYYKKKAWELLELSVLEVLDKPITRDKTTPHAKLYISFEYVYTASMNVCIANPRVI